MQGQLTDANAKTASDALTEMWDAIPKSKRGAFLGHLNEIALYIEGAARVGQLLDPLRSYFLEHGGGEDSPFVQKIDEVRPREETEDGAR